MINGEFYLINTGLSGKLRNMGGFTSPADQIREVKEPRLMTKFDTRESLPRVFWKEDFDSSGVARRLCAGRV